MTGVVQNCEIRNCSVGPGTAFDSGGGVYGGYSSSGKSYLIVSNCMFRSNRSETGQAGALYASLTYGGLVTHCHFEDNWAKTLGGALFSRSTGGELVEFCVFLNNFADSQGSAIAGNYGLIVLRNSLVAGHPDDSAITAISATLHLQNSTVVYNSGWGVRMDSTGAALKTWNSIIYFNGNNLNTGPTCAFTNTCSTPVNAYFTLAGTGNIIDNPQFADAAHGNYRLSSMSPCLNAGTNLPWTLDAVDLDGHPRVDRGGPRIVDMGCYETTYSGSAIVIR